jgi:hypothetical protein
MTKDEKQFSKYNNELSLTLYEPSENYNEIISVQPITTTIKNKFVKLFQKINNNKPAPNFFENL